MHRLLLFDIDGTLLQCGTQVRRIFSLALEEVYGTAGDLDGYDFSGKIDPQIVRELLEPSGLAPDEIHRGLDVMQERYVRRLEAELDAEQMQLLPGVLEELDRLACDDRFTLNLLTGNWRRGAYTKLARLGLDSYFATGAFGGDGVRRSQLLPVAIERARRSTGRDFALADTLIIGDSIHDVACGTAHEVPVLAVTTGWTSAPELAAAGATWVADSLSDGLSRAQL